MKIAATTVIGPFCLLTLGVSVQRAEGLHPDPELTVLRQPSLPASANQGEIVSSDFDWNVYSGDTQPGNPVWINVYAWRDVAGEWAGPEPVIFYHSIPGFYPGHTEFVEPIAISAPGVEGAYTLWAHAFPTVSEATAVQEFKNATISSETNAAKLLGNVDVLAGISEETCLDWIEAGTTDQPSVRGHHAMAWHPENGIVLFGGDNLDPGFLADTWTWDGVNWEPEVVSGPAAREQHAMVYAPACGGIVLFGGAGETDDLDDMWVWNGSAWAVVPTDPQPEAWPPRRRGHALAYDVDRETVVLFGGVHNPCCPWPYLDDTWEWDCSTGGWTERAVSGPEPREGHAMAFDSETGVVLYGGVNEGMLFSDTWSYNGSAWTLIAPPATTIVPARSWVSMSYDEIRHRLVLFGGNPDSIGAGLNDTWEFATGQWEMVQANDSGGLPAQRSRHATAFDPVRGKTVVFGGVATNNTTRFNDTWEYPDVDNVDCNANGVVDSCEAQAGTAADCNSNGVPDECDITDGTSTDCNANGSPDDCEADTDNDHVTDECDNCPAIPNTDQLDFDGDDGGDVCDSDIDSDGVENDADVCDYTPLGAAIITDPASCLYGTLRFDTDDDCDVDLADYAIMEKQFTGPN